MQLTLCLTLHTLGMLREPPYVSSLLLQCLFHDWKSLGTAYIQLKSFAPPFPLSSRTGCCSVSPAEHSKMCNGCISVISLDKSHSLTAEQACLVFANGVLQRG